MSKSTKSSKSTKATKRTPAPKKGALTTRKEPTAPKGAARPKAAQPTKAATLVADDVAQAAVVPPTRASARARALVLEEPDPKKAVAALQKFGATELQRLFHELFQGETRSTSLFFLRKAITKGLQERAGGQPPTQPEAEAKKAQRKQVAAAGERDPRLPPVGAVIERTYKGEALRVKVLEEGFSFKGTAFSSLSALAKTFTKCPTNGFLWFGLAQRPERAAASTETQG